MQTKFTDEEMAGLSDQERAAITAEEDPADTNAAADPGDDPTFGAHVGGETSNIFGDKTKTVDADTATEAAAAKADADKLAADAADKAKADAAAGEKAAETLDARPFAPVYRADPVADYAKKITDLDASKADAKKQLEEGTITVEDFLTKQDEINTQRQDLREQKLKADISADQNTQTAEQRWAWEQETFLDHHAEYKTPALYGALNATVVDIAKREENAAKSGAWILEEAHREVQKTLRPAAPVTKDAAAEKLAADAAAAKAVKDRTDKIPAGPRTLNGLPAADVVDTGGKGEFDHLDNLSGMELENALARMTPEQQERHLQS